jgi:hypothetical protein
MHAQEVIMFHGMYACVHLIINHVLDLDICILTTLKKFAVNNGVVGNENRENSNPTKPIII